MSARTSSVAFESGTGFFCDQVSAGASLPMIFLALTRRKTVLRWTQRNKNWVYSSISTRHGGKRKTWTAGDSGTPLSKGSKWTR